MLGGGEFARDTSFENTRSDMAGVEGRLGDMLETEGWRERCLAIVDGIMTLLSVAADAGAVSGF